MCDLQILTGLGILIGGFMSLPVLKGAHWQMICYLAWFAAVTHISGLTIMTKHLHKRSLERKIRVTLMGILLIMLVVAMVPMAAITLSLDEVPWELMLMWNCNATCFFNRQFMGKPLNSAVIAYEKYSIALITQIAAQFGSTILAIILMCFSFFVRVGRLTPNLHSAIASRRVSISALVQRLLRRVAEKQFSSKGKAVLWRELLARPLVCVFLILRTSYVLWSSMLFEVCAP